MYEGIVWPPGDVEGLSSLFWTCSLRDLTVPEKDFPGIKHGGQIPHLIFEMRQTGTCMKQTTSCMECSSECRNMYSKVLIIFFCPEDMKMFWG